MNQLTKNDKDIVIDMSYFIAAPIEEIFNYLSNPENDEKWQSSCDRVTLNEPEKPIKKGSKYTIHFSFLSRKLSFEAAVAEYQPYQCYAYQTVTGPMPYYGVYHFEEKDGGVNVHWNFTATPGKYFGIIPKSLIKKTMLKKASEDIEKLKLFFQQKKYDKAEIESACC